MTERMTRPGALVGPSCFCQNLSYWLSRRGYTCDEFAARMPYTWAQSPDAGARKVRRYLRGIQDPKLGTVELFARILRVSPPALAWGLDGQQENETWVNPNGDLVHDRPWVDPYHRGSAE